MNLYLVIAIVILAVALTGLIILLCVKFPVAKWITLALITAVMPILALYCGNQLNIYYNASGGVKGYLSGIYGKDEVVAVDNMKFEIKNTEFKYVTEDKYRIEILSNQVLDLNSEKNYGIFVNNAPCYNILPSSKELITANYQYNFYNSDRGLKVNDTLTISVAPYINYTKLTIETNGGEEAVKNWNSYFNKNNFVLEIKETNYRRGTGLQYGDGEVPEVFIVKFMNEDEEISNEIVIKGGTVVTVPKVSKEGFEFIGWSIDKEEVVENIETMKIEQNTTFYAIFEEFTGMIKQDGSKVEWKELVANGIIEIEGGDTFANGSDKLEGQLIVPKSIKKIKKISSQKLENLKFLGLQSMDAGTQIGLPNLIELDLGDSIETLQGVMDVENLKTITIPKSVKKGTSPMTIGSRRLVEIINNSEFQVDDLIGVLNKPKDIFVHTGESKLKTIENVVYYIDGNENIAVGLENPYKLYREQKSISISIQEGCKRVRDFAFADSAFVLTPSGDIFGSEFYSNFKPIIVEAKIANTVEEIGEKAFENQQLKSLILPEKLKKLGKEAFGYITYLKKVFIPKEILNCDDTAFLKCGSPTFYFAFQTDLKFSKNESGDESADFLYKYDFTLEKFLALK